MSSVSNVYVATQTDGPNGPEDRFAFFQALPPQEIKTYLNSVTESLQNIQLLMLSFFLEPKVGMFCVDLKPQNQFTQLSVDEDVKGLDGDIETINFIFSKAIAATTTKIDNLQMKSGFDLSAIQEIVGLEETATFLKDRALKCMNALREKAGLNHQNISIH